MSLWTFHLFQHVQNKKQQAPTVSFTTFSLCLQIVLQVNTLTLKNSQTELVIEIFNMISSEGICSTKTYATTMHNGLLLLQRVHIQWRSHGH